MKDKELITKLGGAAALAKFLNKKYTTVHNWKSRGIPAKYKLAHPELFQSQTPPNLKSKTPKR